MKYKGSVYKAFALITQLGINMLVPVFLCAFIGLYLEKKFSIPVVIPFFILGSLAGFRNVYKTVRNLYHNDEDKDNEKKG